MKGKVVLIAAIIINVSACSILNPESHQPPKSVFQAWSKNGISPDQVKSEMKECGYRDIFNANDLSDQEALIAETCMQNKGFKLDLSSYRPNNCYGNAPYFCKALWGGRAPQLQPVKP